MEKIIKTDRLKLCGIANSPDEVRNILKEVEEKTGVTIQWEPGKFTNPIKKDPMIRICGVPDAVKTAREMILQNLEIQCNRVVLKMDITHEEHPSLIGKKGYLIKQVMENTNCHIHFPDTNLKAESIKSNQVSIAGDPYNVEKARIMLRTLLPFQVIFDIEATSSLIMNKSLPLWKQIEEQLGLDVHFLQQKDVMSVVIRCSQGLFPSVRQQILTLMELLSQKRGSDLPPVRVVMDIMPQHHHFVKGPKGSNIQAIASRTGTKILFPNMNSELCERRHVNIIGNLDCVYMAWQEIMNYLPASVTFDVSETRETNNDYTDFLLDCNIAVYTRPKPRYIKGITVKGPEKFSKQMLQYRQRLLNLPAIKFQPDINDINKAFSFQYTVGEIPHSQIVKNLTSCETGVSLSNPQFENLINALNMRAVFQNTESNFVHPFVQYNPALCPPVSNYVPTPSIKTYVKNEGDVLHSTKSSPSKFNGYHSSSPSKTDNCFQSSSAFNKWVQAVTSKNTEAVIKESIERNPSNCERPDSMRQAFSSVDNHARLESALKKQDISPYEIFEKRLSAHQAIHRPIESTQVPSSLWAGYGFSQSMPAPCVSRDAEPVNRCSSVSLESNSSSSSEDSWNSIVLADYIDDKVWSNNGENVFSMSNVFDFKRNSSMPMIFSANDILPRLLLSEGLYNYIDVFLREEIDYAAFLLLNESDLVKLGIGYQARMKILCLIRELQDSEMKRKSFDLAPGAGRRVGDILGTNI